MNNDAAVAMFFALSTLINNNIGLKKIPPPIPTTPDTNPIDAPMNMDNIFGIFINFNVFDQKIEIS